MYIYKRFRTSKWCLTIVLIALGLAVWGIVELTSNALAKKPDGGGKEEVTYTLEYTQDEGTADLFNLEGLVGTLHNTEIWVRFVESDLSSLGDCWDGHHGGGYWQLVQPKRRLKRVNLQHWFTDTDTGSGYLLRMPGTIIGKWPPAGEIPTKVESSGRWVVSRNGGKDKGDGCGEDDGPDLGWTITITEN